MADEWHRAAHSVRHAVNLLEVWLKENGDDGSIRWAQLWLAHAQLINAHTNLIKGEMTPESMRRFLDRTKEVVEEEKGRSSVRL